MPARGILRGDMEKTLIILKPDCMEKRLAGVVLDRFQKAGFDIVAAKLTRLAPGLLAEHYAHIADRPFFPPLAQFMGSRPVLVAVLQGEGVIAKVRELLGPTDSKKAPKGTIRGDFGTDVTVNVCHASDSPESAVAEIARFFLPSELFA
ncbi:MAG: nucleoside-diphosphate kinase [Puniceicoccales bacterium]|jgi:nucleoside-diphosphate kinase|nr:nucleoside-diphosphate kinase [Puniceicoccales bacterium]